MSSNFNLLISSSSHLNSILIIRVLSYLTSIDIDLVEGFNISIKLTNIN